MAARGDGWASSDAVTAFVSYWDLDDNASQALFALDPTTLSVVMDGFNPRDTSRGASPALMGFIRSITSKSGWNHTSGSSTQWQSANTSFEAPCSNERTLYADSGEGFSDADEFISYWQLDDKAGEALRQLDPETQKRVMNGFTPKDTSRGASPAFMGFVRSVNNNKSNFKPPAAFGPSVVQKTAKTMEVWAAGAGDQDSGSHEQVEADPEAVARFLSQWEIDHSAAQSLLALDPVAQKRVMDGFNPKDTSRGASPALVGFIRSVLSRGDGSGTRWTPPAAFGSGGGSNSRSHPYGLTITLPDRTGIHLGALD